MPGKEKRPTSSSHIHRQRVVVLSRKRSLYSTRRLVEAIKQAGHKPLVLDTLRCNLVVASGAPKMLYRGVEVQDVDAVIPRIGASITPYGLAVVSHFELMGVPVVNGATAISRSRDKLRSLQLLSLAGISVPRTVMAHKQSQVGRLLQEAGGLPVIIKLLRGTQGVGVMIANTQEEAETILQTFWDLGQEVMLQEFIAEAKGADVRVLVVGNEAVGAMRRQAKKGEFRSNIHRGGKATSTKLPKAVLDMAVKAASVLGVGIAGVDVLESKDGPRVMEVNSSPGFEGLEKATGRDIARGIVDYAVSLCRKK